MAHENPNISALKHANPSSPKQSRYVVGFDLGTTNSAVAYVDTNETPWTIKTFAVPQIVAPGQVETRETLPSFHYQAASGEFPPKSLRFPWQNHDPEYAVGFFARDQGTLTPGRLIASAKSWLCHSGVDRTAPLLPWQGAADVERLSPVEVSSRYLMHVRDAWNAKFPRHLLAEQDFVLTLPASFDEIARELTVKAAAAAGLPRVVLIEEPQAAFYAWIYAHADDWEQRVSPGQKILVCDIGGGTSDFTLIRVRRSEGGRVQFHRVAVGDHLILGGDNFDLTLAQYVEQKIGKLSPRQWAVLVRTCRVAKETLLGENPPERLTLTLPGAGSKLLGAAVQVELTRNEVCELLIDGFFPAVPLDAKPISRRSGFQEFGLPFAPDAAITRYLASFLTAHRHVAMEDEADSADHDTARPDIVLFNGGVMESALLKGRLIESLERWFNVSQDGDWHPIVLDNDRLDLAVAHGAAYYGMVRRGQGVRIAAGLARTYYIGVETGELVASGQWLVASETPEAVASGQWTVDSEAGVSRTEASSLQPPTSSLPSNPQSPIPSLQSPVPRPQPPAPCAVCLLPAGIEPGHDVELADRRFNLLVSEPAEFPLFVSSTRLTDKPGELVAIDRERMTPLPPVRTVLRSRKKDAAETVAVTLHARLTEIGTVDLWCGEIGGRRSWRLQFDVRSTTQTDVAAHQSQAESEGMVDEAVWQACHTLIENTFGPDSGTSNNDNKPEGLIKRLAAASGMSRNAWPTSLCRRMWETLMEFEAGRRRSATHETRWLNLLGFSLRPGYGLAVDDWRVAQTWTTLQGRFVHASANVLMEGWILWRRIAGGLAPGQQQALAEPLLGLIRSLHRQLTTGRGRSDFHFNAHETAEMWRLLGSLELLPPAMKTELGGLLLDLLPKRKMEPVRPAMIWALGRLGARVPMYGPLNAVVPADVAARWLTVLLGRKLLGGKTDEKSEKTPERQLAIMQLARRTDDRYRDLAEKLRREAMDWLTVDHAPAHFIDLIRVAGRLDSDEEGLIFGESLPKGLRMA